MSMVEPDEAGAIDTGDDNSGAAPVTPLPQSSAQPGAIETPVEDDSGTSPPAAPQQQPPQQSLGNAPPQGPLKAVGQKIVSYLMGAGAAHPDTIEQMGKEIDPDGKLPPADRNLIALDKLREAKGDNAAWALMQANRVAYNGQTAFAKTALNGTQQKPANMGAAIDAANKAQANVLDGSNVSFAHHGQGVTATVTMPGTSEPQTIQLSPQAFASWLDVGGDGQWDKVMQNSAPATLQKLAQQYPMPNVATVGAPAQARQPRAPAARAPAPAQQAAPQAQAGGDEGDEDTTPVSPAAPQSAAVRTGKSIATDVTQGDQPALPGTHDANGHSLQAPAPDKTNYGEELEARSNARFGKGNVGNEGERQQWMANQEQESAKLENAVKVAQEKGKNDIEKAKVTGTGRNVGEQIKADAKTGAATIYTEGKKAIANANQAAAQGKRASAEDHAAIESARKDLDAKRANGIKLTPDEEAFASQLTQSGLGKLGQRPQSGAQGTQPAAPQAAQVPPADKRVLNQVYNTPKGPHRWMGNGWQPVQ